MLSFDALRSYVRHPDAPKGSNTSLLGSLVLLSGVFSKSSKHSLKDSSFSSISSKLQASTYLAFAIAIEFLYFLNKLSLLLTHAASIIACSSSPISCPTLRAVIVFSIEGRLADFTYIFFSASPTTTKPF